MVKTEHIARRYFTPEEQEYCAVYGAHGFFQIWAAKEGYTKWLGLGLSHPISSFSTVDSLKLNVQLPGCWLQHFDFQQGYTGCICTSVKTNLCLIKHMHI